MKLVIQRVSEASVRVGQEEVASIGPGLLILAGAESGDEEKGIQALAEKVLKLRIFEDPQGKMNLSIQEIQGELLVVSQFTLAANLSKGNRPSFDSAEQPEKAQVFIEQLVASLEQSGLSVKQGRFGAKMQVQLVNEGPVTFLL